ncbi:MAG TPA: class I SAM-dependent methyltransferase [Spirochaetia bacterium]|jgi:SAM-dependent methyltransferase|nr:class I SAM-dependent methyltransferase [Spirochaetia bacterium]
MTKSETTIRRYYDDAPDREWERFDRHPLEFEVTKRLLSRHLGDGPREILDVGGGPGRYALWLAQAGHRVSLVDLSPGNVDFARAMAAQLGVTQASFAVGNALDLGAVTGGKTFDVVLLFGPLYHLLEESERIRAVDQALESLRPGGLFAAGFISCYAPSFYAFKHCPQALVGSVDQYHGWTVDGRNPVAEDHAGFTDAHFTSPAEVNRLMERFGLEKIGLYSAEGFLMPFEEGLKTATPEVLGACLDLAMRLIDREELTVLGEHFLYLGRKR